MASSTTSSRTMLLLLLLVLPFSANAFFILNHKTLVRTRLDPIVQPGVVSQHMHTIVGGSRFGRTYTYDDLRKSKCTTAEVQEDKSNYWAPQLYYYNPTAQTFKAINSYTKTYYLQRPGSKNEKIVAPPAGLRMVSGNPNRRTFDASSFADQAINFVCLDYYNSHAGDPNWEQRNDFFPQNCPDGMRAQVFFPSCWNGVDLDSPDHKSHMAFPIDSFQGGNCPATHPVHIVSIFYEFVFYVGDYPFNPAGTPTWVFANGDTTGYGFHADFTNGWPTGENNILQQALDTCGLETGGDVGACAVLAPYIDRNAANACQPETEVVNEDVGYEFAISALPGDNPVWIGNGSKPSTPGYNFNPGYTASYSILPTGWSNLGCIAEGTTGGRAMVGAFMNDNKNMTLASCATYCQGLGFPYAGVEYGQECYCDSVLRHGASTTTINANKCSTICPGLASENCGGASVLTLMYNPDNKPAPPSLPAGWAAGSCQTEPSGARALTSASTSGSKMTVEMCVNYCDGKGYSIAGIEYGQECYCGNTLATNSAVAPDIECDKPCAGNKLQTCGGSSRLTTYKFAGAKTSTTSSVAAPAASAAVTLSNGWTSTGACYSDRPRIMTSDAVYNNAGLTYEICAKYCADTGYTQAGVEYGSQCFCSNNVDLVNVARATNCDVPCGGNKAVNCGGSYAMNIFSAPSSSKVATTSVSSSSSAAKTSAVVSTSSAAPSAAATGAAITLSNGWTSNGRCLDDSTRLMTTGYEDSAMTYESCANYCSGKGYSQAGVEYGSQCFCSSTADLVNAKTSSNFCNVPCGGNKALNCGGSYALLAFSAPASGNRVIAAPTTTSTSSTTSSTATTSSSVAAPTTTSSSAPKTSSSTTSSSTSTTSTSVSSAASPSASGSITLPNGWTSTGSCLSDSPRIMGDYLLDSKSLTYTSCVSFCIDRGFSQAGVEYGTQCSCSNGVDLTKVGKSTNCNVPCAGEAGKICGGGNAIMVFEKPKAAATMRRRMGGGVWSTRA